VQETVPCVGTSFKPPVNSVDKLTSFTSLFPAAEPQIVMVVKLDEPKGEAFAAATAAPITKAVLEQLLAAETGVLERTRLATAAPPQHGDLLAPPSAVTTAMAWPPATANDSADNCVVPDVRGLTLRAAAKRLHELGLRMQLSGWGSVRAVDPAPGTVVLKGTAVRLTADDRGSRR